METSIPRHSKFMEEYTMNPSIMPDISSQLFFDMSGLHYRNFRTEVDDRLNSSRLKCLDETIKSCNTTNSEEKNNLEKLMETSVLKDIEKQVAVPERRLSRKTLQKQNKKKAIPSAGKQWFDMKAPTNLSTEDKQDLAFIQVRAFADPKHHWKKGVDSSAPKFFELGTLAPSPVDFYTDGRSKAKLSKKHFVDHLLEDQEQKKYAKRKYDEIQEKNYPASRKEYFNRKAAARKKKRRVH